MIRLSTISNNAFAIFDYKNEIECIFEIDTDKIVISFNNFKIDDKQNFNKIEIEKNDNKNFISLLNKNYLGLINNLENELVINRKLEYPNYLYTIFINKFDNIINITKNSLNFKWYFNFIKSVNEEEIPKYEIVKEDWNSYIKNKDIWIRKQIEKKEQLIKYNNIDIISELNFLKRYSMSSPYNKELLAIINNIEFSFFNLKENINSIRDLCNKQINIENEKTKKLLLNYSQKY